MYKHTMVGVVTLCAAALLGPAVATSSAAPATAPATAHRQLQDPVLVDCLWHPEVRPTDFMLACGDGNSRLTSLRWTEWNANSATATGFNVVNDCKPYCAVGKFHSFPVTVRLDSTQTWKRHPQVRQYGEITLTYTGARPDRFQHTVTYPLWN
ncbi:hypothetical protein JHN63_26675 [Streptomyces sp. MBT65]|uniref:hypothetical protein n=1 Tax=Streptomyces sp. MBT65 TaxID=1488395 RepID=UPI0019093DC3|nr:hypothetical protein [Streptomyces sp. MBT65]MBK3577322.1 hypothetical protein [Streptomyces sp. MBT65]